MGRGGGVLKYPPSNSGSILPFSEKCRKPPHSTVGEAVSKPPHLWRGKVRAKPPHYYRGLLENVLEKSRIPSQLNPVDAVFRMAADMSACFSAPRAIQGVYVKTKSRTFPTFTKQCRSLCYCVLFRIMRGTRRVTFSSAGSSASARRASSGSKRRAAEVEARSAEPSRGPMFGALCAWGSGAGALRHGLRHVGCDC